MSANTSTLKNIGFSFSALIDYDSRWLKMIDDRNLAAHLYEEKFADKIYSRLPDYLELLKKLFSSIKKEN